MEQKAIFLEQLRATHNQNHWFVSLQSSLQGLTVDQASWKNTNFTNSIWEIVNHLIFYNKRYLNRFKGKFVSESEITNNSTFINQEDIEWQRTVEQIDEIFNEWESLIKECDEEKLDSTFNDNSSGTWWTVISNMFIHNAYHIGQIVHIRKQQGSWDSNNGVH